MGLEGQDELYAGIQVSIIFILSASESYHLLCATTLNLDTLEIHSYPCAYVWSGLEAGLPQVVSG